MATTAKPTTLDPRDFLAIDALFDEEERAIRDTIRQFVRDRVLPDVGDWFERGVLPPGLAGELADLGLFGMHLEGYGLPGASSVAYGLTCMELEAGDAGVRSLVSVQGSLAMFAIWRWGSEDQKQRWLPAMHAGEAIGCFGLTEPDAGSDPGAMRTTAKRDGSDWILNGAKMWITNGSIADISVVWARTEDGSINGFLVERGTPGFEAPDMHHKLSLRASVTSELVLRDVRIPEENRFPEVSTLRGPLSCLSEARYGIVWGAVGSARACYEAALEYAKERIVFGKPIAGYQLTQQKLAEMALEVNRGLLVALHLGRMKDARDASPRAREHGQDGQRPRRARGRPVGALDPRRQRHHARVSGHPPHEQPRVGPDVRGHPRGAHARRRPGDHRSQRVSLTLSRKRCAFPAWGRVRFAETLDGKAVELLRVCRRRFRSARAAVPAAGPHALSGLR